MITVMSVAGFDPSAGAGILADIKTISAFGCYGVAAITSLTLQNTRAVLGAHHQAKAIVREQMKLLFDDFNVAAIKTGMLAAQGTIEEVAECISSEGIRHVVVDPVMRSTSGYELVDEDGIQALIKCLFPIASLVTPNVIEAEHLTGVHIKDEQAMEQAAQAIFDMGARAVLVTGGDLGGELATDVLFDEDGPMVISAKRIQSKHTHGTGCALASAIACLLARGFALRDALPIAKRYVTEAIRTAPGLGRGRGPLNHFPPGFDAARVSR
jgi:hydroxymethylpyrimidine/phosphomethylpyrimidine kinase